MTRPGCVAIFGEAARAVKSWSPLVFLLLLPAAAMAQPGVITGPRVTFTHATKSVDSSAANVRRWQVEYSADGGPWRIWFGGRSSVDMDGKPWAGTWTWQSGYRDSISFRARNADNANPPNWAEWSNVMTWRRRP